MALVRERRQAAIVSDTTRENKRRSAFNYHPGGYVLLYPDPNEPKLTLNKGPFKIEAVNRATGTLRIKRVNYVEPINIRRVRPYFGSSSGGD